MSGTRRCRRRRRPVADESEAMTQPLPIHPPTNSQAKLTPAGGHRLPAQLRLRWGRRRQGERPVRIRLAPRYEGKGELDAAACVSRYFLGASSFFSDVVYVGMVRLGHILHNVLRHSRTFCSEGERLFGNLKRHPQTPCLQARLAIVQYGKRFLFGCFVCSQS